MRASIKAKFNRSVMIHSNHPVKIEVKVGDQIIAFKNVPKKELFKAIHGWVKRYQYDYFRTLDKTEGSVLQPFWTKQEFLETAKGHKLPHDVKPHQKVKILRRRIGRNYSQARLAKDIRTSQGTIASIEAGKRNIGKRMAKKLGDAFGVDPRIFLEPC